MLRLFSTVLMASLLAACGSQPRYAEPKQGHVERYNPPNETRQNPPRNGRLLDYALEQQGIRYRYGGNSPGSGFDCSGLIQFSYAQVGKRIPRTTQQQFRSSMPISIGRIRPGDLLFYETEGRRPGHVAMYLGQGEMIHAPSSGKQVKISRLNNPYWRSRLIAAGRF